MKRVISQILPKKKKKSQFNPFQDEPPVIVSTSIDYIENNGLHVEGIFRLTGELKKVNTIIQRFEQGKTNSWEKKTDPHLVAAVLKTWLCNLEEPLLTAELHESFVAAQAATTHEGTMRRMATVISLLPPGNRNIFERLIEMLVKIDRNQEINKMSVSNLAIIFSPMLLRCDVGSDLARLLLDSEAANKIVHICVNNFEELFRNTSKWVNKRNLKKTASTVGFNRKVKKGGLLLAKKIEEDIENDCHAEEIIRKSNIKEKERWRGSISISASSYKNTSDAPESALVSRTVSFTPKATRNASIDDELSAAILAAEIKQHEIEEAKLNSLAEQLSDIHLPLFANSNHALHLHSSTPSGFLSNNANNNEISFEDHVLEEKSKQIEESLVELEQLSKISDLENMDTVLDEENRRKLTNLLLGMTHTSNSSNSEATMGNDEELCLEEEARLLQLEEEEHHLLLSSFTNHPSSTLIKGEFESNIIDSYDDGSDVMSRFEEEAMLQLQQMQQQEEELEEIAFGSRLLAKDSSEAVLPISMLQSQATSTNHHTPSSPSSDNNNNNSNGVYTGSGSGSGSTPKRFGGNALSTPERKTLSLAYSAKAQAIEDALAAMDAEYSDDENDHSSDKVETETKKQEQEPHQQRVKAEEEERRRLEQERIEQEKRYRAQTAAMVREQQEKLHEQEELVRRNLEAQQRELDRLEAEARAAALAKQDLLAKEAEEREREREKQAELQKEREKQREEEEAQRKKQQDEEDKHHALEEQKREQVLLLEREYQRNAEKREQEQLEQQKRQKEDTQRLLQFAVASKQLTDELQQHEQALKQRELEEKQREQERKQKLEDLQKRKQQIQQQQQQQQQEQQEDDAVPSVDLEEDALVASRLQASMAEREQLERERSLKIEAKKQEIERKKSALLERRKSIPTIGLVTKLRSPDPTSSTSSNDNSNSINIGGDINNVLSLNHSDVRTDDDDDASTTATTTTTTINSSVDSIDTTSRDVDGGEKNESSNGLLSQHELLEKRRKELAAKQQALREKRKLLTERQSLFNIAPVTHDPDSPTTPRTNVDHPTTTTAATTTAVAPTNNNHTVQQVQVQDLASQRESEEKILLRKQQIEQKQREINELRQKQQKHQERLRETLLQEQKQENETQQTLNAQRAKVQQIIEERKRALLLQKQTIEQERLRREQERLLQIENDKKSALSSLADSEASVDGIIRITNSITISTASPDANAILSIDAQSEQLKAEALKRRQIIEQKRKELEMQKLELEKKRAAKSVNNSSSNNNSNSGTKLLSVSAATTIPVHTVTTSSSMLSDNTGAGGGGDSNRDSKRMHKNFLTQFIADTVAEFDGSISSTLLTEQEITRKSFDEKENVYVIEYKDGSSFRGQLENDKWNGHARLVFADGHVYEGQVKDNQIHGMGTMVYVNGDKYVGEWENDQRHGWGRLVATTGDVYEGGFEYDVRSGKGTSINATGDKYEGHFADNLFNGHGVLRFENGDVFTGEFLDDKFKKGVFMSASGTKYDGEYVNGVKEGFGKYTLINGDEFEGQFKNGKFNGEGVYSFVNGDRISGLFENGKPVLNK